MHTSVRCLIPSVRHFDHLLDAPPCPAPSNAGAPLGRIRRPRRGAGPFRRRSAPKIEACGRVFRRFPNHSGPRGTSVSTCGPRPSVSSACPDDRSFDPRTDRRSRDRPDGYPPPGSERPDDRSRPSIRSPGRPSGSPAPGRSTGRSFDFRTNLSKTPRSGLSASSPNRASNWGSGIVDAVVDRSKTRLSGSSICRWFHWFFRFRLTEGSKVLTIVCGPLTSVCALLMPVFVRLTNASKVLTIVFRLLMDDGELPGRHGGSPRRCRDPP